MFFLTATPVVPGTDLRVQVVGAASGATVEVLAGRPGGHTCDLVGPCLDMNLPRTVGTGTVDPEGRFLLSVPTPRALVVGQGYVLQARVVDPITGATTVSRPVTGTVATSRARGPNGNVLIVVLDDVGVDRVGVYGVDPLSRTPVIDGLAAEGMRFDNAWAMSLCAPTRASLMTGRFPRRHGIGTNPFPPTALNELGADQTTLAELVRASPWGDVSTALVGKWHLSTETSASGLLGPFVQGFEQYLGPNGNLNPNFWSPAPAPLDAGYYHWQRTGADGVYTDMTSYVTTTTVDDALDVLDTMTGPWMMVLAFNGAHAPLHAPPTDLHTFDGLVDTDAAVELHRAMVEAVDTELGRLLDTIAPEVLDVTTVFVLADNGTMEDAIVEPLSPLRGKPEVYDGGVRIPFVVKGPRVLPGSVNTSLVSVVDVFPTVARLAGVNLEQLPAPLRDDLPLTVDGLDLTATLADPSVPVHDVLFAERFAPGGSGPYEYDRRTIRDDRYKLIWDAIDGQEQFFEYVPGAVDEGPDLLYCGVLTAEQEAARQRLRARLDEIVGGMTFDTAPFLDDPDGWHYGDRVWDPRCGG